MGSPLFMRDVKLSLKLVAAGTRVDYQCDVSTAEILPEPGDDVTYSTLCPTGSYSSVGKTTYALHIVAAQNWDTTGGLARFLWDNDGALAEFQYQAHGIAAIPPTTILPGMTGIVRLVAGAYGGEVDTYAELDITMPCQSKPTITVAAFPALARGEEGYVEDDGKEAKTAKAAA